MKRRHHNGRRSNRFFANWIARSALRKYWKPADGVESLNQATVYRNVKLLLENGWLKQVCHPSLGTLYERTGKGHHHHFHCRVCNRVYDLPGCALNEREAAPSGFLVEDHECFLFGVCPACHA